MPDVWLLKGNRGENINPHSAQKFTDAQTAMDAFAKDTDFALVTVQDPSDIRIVVDFILYAYNGSWHKIEYPQEYFLNQLGI